MLMWRKATVQTVIQAQRFLAFFCEFRQSLGYLRMFSKSLKAVTVGLLKVNGETILAFEYDRLNRTETVLDRRHDNILSINYDAVGRVVQISPRRPIDGLRVGYDHHGRITKWSRGVLNVTATFDDRGRLVERRFGTRTVYSYVHSNGSKVTAFCFLFTGTTRLKIQSVERW